MGFFSKLFGSDKPVTYDRGRGAAGSAPEIGDALFEAATGSRFYKPGGTTYDPNAPQTRMGVAGAYQDFANKYDIPRFDAAEGAINKSFGSFYGDNGQEFLKSFQTQRSQIMSQGDKSLIGNLRAVKAGAARSGFKSDGGTEMGVVRANNFDTNALLAALTQREQAARGALFNATLGHQGALGSINDARRESVMRPYLTRLQAVQAMPGFGTTQDQYTNTGLFGRVVKPIAGAVGSFFGGLGAFGG